MARVSAVCVPRLARPRDHPLVRFTARGRRFESSPAVQVAQRIERWPHTQVRLLHSLTQRVAAARCSTCFGNKNAPLRQTIRPQAAAHTRRVTHFAASPATRHPAASPAAPARRCSRRRRWRTRQSEDHDSGRERRLRWMSAAQTPKATLGWPPRPALSPPRPPRPRRPPQEARSGQGARAHHRLASHDTDATLTAAAWRQTSPKRSPRACPNSLAPSR